MDKVGLWFYTAALARIFVPEFFLADSIGIVEEWSDLENDIYYTFSLGA